jgi:hypothetical protein
LGAVISKVHSLKNTGFKTFEKLYVLCVVPVLDYCSAIWGFRNDQQIDNIQNRTIRYYLGVHRFTPVLALTGDTGWLPSIYRRWLNMVRYWNKLVQSDDHRITKQAFSFMTITYVRITDVVILKKY